MNMVFQLDRVTRRFGAVEALRGIDLEVVAGERMALIGPSGGGKTTLLKVMGAQLAPDEGAVRVLGRNPLALGERELRALRASLAFIPQDLGLVPNLRVIQNVVEGRFGKRSLWGAVRDLVLPAVEERRRIFELLTRVGIAEKMYDRVDALSGGQQQRVAVARSLFQQPEVLLADEPISAVDPARARQLLELLVELGEEEHLTLVVSMHQLALARELFPRLVGLKDGLILFDRGSDELEEGVVRELYQLESDE